MKNIYLNNIFIGNDWNGSKLTLETVAWWKLKRTLEGTKGSSRNDKLKLLAINGSMTITFC